MSEFSISHWLVILTVVLIFFGGRRIPEIMKGLGDEVILRKQQPLPRPLRFSRGETPWQAFIRHLRRLLSKLRARLKRG